MSHTDTAQEIIDKISFLIRRSLRIVENESSHPLLAADESDDKIRLHKERVKELRRLRQEFEDLMSEPE